MTNLVPLQLDKDTGKTIATRSGLALGNNPASGFFRTVGFLHEETIAATTWNINHTANIEHFNVQIFDSLGNVIIPDEIIIADADNTIINFASPQDGKAVFIFFS